MSIASTTPELGPEFLNPTERYQLDRVIAAVPVSPEAYGIDESIAPGGIYEMILEDPYIQALEAKYPGVYAGVQAIESSFDEMARNRRLAGAWQRRPGTAYVDEDGSEQTKEKAQWGDPVSTHNFFGPDGLNNKGLDAWRTLIPSADALRYLSDPINIPVVTDKEGNMMPLNDEARAWMALCSDAIGTRSRGTIMAELVRAYADAQLSKENMSWMSVACGTALPAMIGAVRAGISPKLTLLDIDRSAMESTKALAPEIGFKGEIDQQRKNIFNPVAMAKLRDSLMADGKDNRPQFMDLMGILEYTGEELGVDPVAFLRSNYDLLRPGGRLVFGQMRNDRPNPDFTMGVVGWPYVSMRSPAEVMQIIHEAGIPTSSVRLFLAQDGVYTVCSIDKPYDAN